MNKVILLGNLTRDPEIRYTTGAQALAITRFTVAVQRRVKSDSGTDADFFNCVSFGKTAENINRFFTKGRKIAISGRLQNNNWEDDNGVKHYNVDIIVEDFDFCDSKANTAVSAPAEEIKKENFGSLAEHVEIAEDDEELPF